MLDSSPLYVCPVCFRECDSPEECHDHSMLECWPGKPDSFRRRPLHTTDGRFYSCAPLWFLEASGWLNAYAPYTLWRR